MGWGNVDQCLPVSFARSMEAPMLPDSFNPDSCTIEIFALEKYPEWQVAETQWKYKTNIHDDSWPLLVKQDFSNLEAQQKGLHSDSHDGLLPIRFRKPVSSISSAIWLTIWRALLHSRFDRLSYHVPQLDGQYPSGLEESFDRRRES
jgi:hypothetical protein